MLDSVPLHAVLRKSSWVLECSTEVPLCCVLCTVVRGVLSQVLHDCWHVYTTCVESL
jgi:hypothetical protein